MQVYIPIFTQSEKYSQTNNLINPGAFTSEQEAVHAILHILIEQGCLCVTSFISTTPITVDDLTI